MVNFCSLTSWWSGSTTTAWGTRCSSPSATVSPGLRRCPSSPLSSISSQTTPLRFWVYSIFCACVVFSILGYMAHSTSRPVDQVATWCTKMTKVGSWIFPVFSQSILEDQITRLHYKIKNLFDLRLCKAVRVWSLSSTLKSSPCCQRSMWLQCTTCTFFLQKFSIPSRSEIDKQIKLIISNRWLDSVPTLPRSPWHNTKNLIFNLT